MADVEFSYLDVGAAVKEVASNLRVSEYAETAVFNTPAEEVQVSALEIAEVTEIPAHPAEISQLDVCVVLRGRVENPKVRAFRMTLDGHEYYVLKLGDDETLVYDTFSQQWSEYGEKDSLSARWRVNYAINWLGSGTQQKTYGSNILLGDDTYGTLYFADPEYPYDEPAIAAREREPFLRVATGQVTVRGASLRPCFNAILTGSFGKVYNDTMTAVTLETSDDAGMSYVNHGTVTVPARDYAARVEWLSLGSMNAPGRIFRITDTGALARIDDLVINDGSD